MVEIETTDIVAPREGRVSRNGTSLNLSPSPQLVAPREGRVSRNIFHARLFFIEEGRAPRGACE